MNKTSGFLSVAVVLAFGLSWVQYNEKDKQKTKDELKIVLTDAQVQLLKDELASERAALADERSKPKYDTGYRDCILHMGGPQQPGSYQDGFNAAVKLLQNQDWAGGYHAAIEQFSYQGTPIVPKPKEEKTEKK